MAINAPRALLLLGILIGGMSLAQDEAAEAEAMDGEAVEEADPALDREGERCISTRAIRDTDIVDARTILFRMRGGEYYVNHLTNSCRGLLRERRFSYRTSVGRLCSVDSIRVIEQFGGSIREGMSCGLGAFYPVTEEEADLMKVETAERRGRPRMTVENPNATDEDGETTSAAPEGENDEATAL